MKLSRAEVLLSESSHFRDYLELCKPKVVALMLLTTWVGMCLASPTWVPLQTVLPALLGIGLAAASAATINHVVDRRIDVFMKRTKRRPIPMGKVAPKQALIFAGVIGAAGLLILTLWVNHLVAWLTAFTVMGYAVIYTVFLKHMTPQNIVIGGLAGAAPPLLGWVAMTGQLSPYALLLVLIIFAWTPPHFWALAIYRLQDYESADVPMLPVTHGVKFTKLSIVLYTILLFGISLLPFATKMSGVFYACAAVVLGVRYLYWSFKLYALQAPIIAMQNFKFSISYLALLFLALLIDHYMLAGVFGSWAVLV